MTTKICPDCGNTHLARIQSQNLKYCVDCGRWIAWTLDPGQPALLKSHRAIDTPVNKG